MSKLELVQAALEDTKQELPQETERNRHRETEWKAREGALQRRMEEKDDLIERLTRRVETRTAEADEAAAIAQERETVHLDTFLSRIMYTIRLEGMNPKQSLDDLDGKVSEAMC